MVDEIKEKAAAAGRNPAEIAIAPQYVVHVGKTNDAAIARFRQSQMYKHLVSLGKSTLKAQKSLPMEDINLIGNPAAVIEKAERLKDAGVTHFLGLYFAANDVQELLDQMQLFAEEVTPKIV
jgi:alkanesulfonate monooxygenase SsuD/methylene tetrahydromethanopterin reductase-like flavin-dependent oxidoreductase (luciferase family)